jgi:SAM-dependent methyltransferase
MHYTAMKHGKLFFDTYLPGGGRVIDLGAQDVNGSLREVAPAGTDYVGVDFTPGRGVDVVLTDPYALPFPDASFDACVSSSVFEHAELFWLVFLEVLRVLKPTGLLYMNVPSNGSFHRYPVDCWRFYPDAGRALETWGRRSGIRTVCLESFTGRQENDGWNDFIAVFVRDEEALPLHPRRMVDHYRDFTNGLRHGSDEIINRSGPSEDQRHRSFFRKLRLRMARGRRFVPPQPGVGRGSGSA